jgi:large subunit ribosomal protein L31
MAKVAEGDDALLAIDGFGQKSLIDLKKKLRQIGYSLPDGK